MPCYANCRWLNFLRDVEGLMSSCFSQAIHSKKKEKFFKGNSVTRLLMKMSEVSEFFWVLTHLGGGMEVCLLAWNIKINSCILAGKDWGNQRGGTTILCQNGVGCLRYWLTGNK